MGDVNARLTETNMPMPSKHPNARLAAAGQHPDARRYVIVQLLSKILPGAYLIDTYLQKYVKGINSVLIGHVWGMWGVLDRYVTS